MKVFRINIIILISVFCSNAICQTELPIPQVRYASFNMTTGNIDIRWNPLTTSNVDHYEVNYYYPDRGTINGGWKVINSNNIPASADLIYSFNPADLDKADPLSEPVIIGVQAFSNDGTDPSVLLETKFDSTIFLEAQYDSCQATANLKWNAYNFKQWTQPGSSGYEIYISTDNGVNYNLLTTISSGQTEYNIQNLNPNQDYTIYISSVSSNNYGDNANSNSVFINTDMAILPDYIYANYATYNGQTDISFTIDPLSETKSYNLLRANAPNDKYDTIQELFTSDKELVLQDNINYSTGPYYYKLEVINYCGVNIRESENIASSILLNTNEESLSPTLSWNEYLNFLNGLDNYILERKFGNENFSVITTTSATSYTDDELAGLVENNYSAQVCYLLTAEENSSTNLSKSNSVCYELPVNIRFEFDAFMPGGGTGNDSFGPTIDFIPDEYVFKVLNRNGTKVYESKDPENTRWDGLIKGSPAPQGAYMCVVQYRIGGGKRHVIHGGVAVVY